MPLIVTITFNPCIDKSVTVPFLIPEKKLKCTGPVMEPGGGGINVARVIKKLGGSTMAVYLGGGYHGALLTQLLGKEQVPVLPVEIAEDSRENWIVLEQSTNNQFRFGMPGPNINESEWQECLKKISQLQEIEFIVVSGSHSEGIPVDIFERIKAIAVQKKAKLVVDTSGEALQRALQCRVYMIKPSMNELTSLIKALNLDSHSATAAAHEIVERGYAEVVVVSMGADGAILVTKDMTMSFRPPAVKKVSTVGAGDSMVAGILFSLAHNRSLENSVRYGVACGTAAIMNPGTALCRLEDVITLYPLIKQQSENSLFKDTGDTILKQDY